MLSKLPIVAIFGSGSPIGLERAGFARDAGALVARLNVHLLTGAGYGVMAAAAEGFVAVAGRAGLSIGIVPREPDGPFDEPDHAPDGRTYPNPSVEIAIRTPLPPRVEEWQTIPARNHVNVLTADLIVALPGGVGTANELDIAADYYGERSRPRSERRTILAGPVQEFAPRHRELFMHAETLVELEVHLRRALAARGFARVLNKTG
jgi:predicted Rossmann-fold nucleotide-binding protein